MLQNIATKMGARHISHDSYFRLADGQPNDGYILADGLHLNTRGSNRLVLNLGLTTTNSNVMYRNKSKIYIQNDKEKEAGCVDDTSHSFWQQAKMKATRHTKRQSATQPQPKRDHNGQPTASQNNYRRDDRQIREYSDERGHSMEEWPALPHQSVDYAHPRCKKCGEHTHNTRDCWGYGNTGHKQKACHNYNQRKDTGQESYTEKTTKNVLCS